MNILIVEDSHSARFRLVSLLDGRNDYRVVASVASAEAALEFMSSHCVDLVILDLGLPGISNEHAVRAIKEASPGVEILVFTVAEEESRVFPVLKAGASGYSLKTAQPFQIIASIEEIKAGGAPLSPSIARKVLREFQRQPAVTDLKESLTPLSSRETQILELLYRGRTLCQIADTLSISFHTVHSHLKNIYSKLHVNSRSQAIHEALQQNFLVNT
jgi:DNA-binding NarL/FixJ family response regulator